jgi:choline monooxygenase
MSGLSTQSAELLAQLQQCANNPPERAYTMPPALYNSDEIYDLELENIFAKEWHCPGLAAEIPNPGDFITYSIGTQSVLTVRLRDGTIASYSNVCRHRMMKLLEGRGNVRKVVCPYHAWTYDLDGRLIGAGHMQRTQNFNKEEYCLPEIRTEVWNGWIYISLNPDIPSVASQLEPLRHLIERYDLAGYVPVIHQDQAWKTNWKLLAENFLEGYHAHAVHRETVGTGFSPESLIFPEQSHDAFTYQLFTKDERARYGRAHVDNNRLTDHWRYTSILPIVYPAHLFSLAPDYLWYLSLRPNGSGEVLVRIGVALAPEVYAALPDKEEFLGSFAGFFDKVNAEDRAVVEGIYCGSLAPLAKAGPLSWLERNVYDFMCYLSRRLPHPGQIRHTPAEEQSAVVGVHSRYSPA